MIEDSIEEGKQLHKSILDIEERLNGRTNEHNEEAFAKHLDAVKAMVEERLGVHNTSTEEGKVLQAMEMSLASHGIFDAAVASTLVPLCHDISPELGNCLITFREKQATIVSDLSRAVMKMNDMRSRALMEVDDLRIELARRKAAAATTLSLTINSPPTKDEAQQQQQQQRSKSPSSKESSPSSSAFKSPSHPHLLVHRVGNNDPKPRISPGRHFEGDPAAHRRSISPTRKTSSMFRDRSGSQPALNRLSQVTSPPKPMWHPEQPVVSAQDMWGGAQQSRRTSVEITSPRTSRARGKEANKNNENYSSSRSRSSPGGTFRLSSGDSSGNSKTGGGEYDESASIWSTRIFNHLLVHTAGEEEEVAEEEEKMDMSMMTVSHIINGQSPPHSPEKTTTASSPGGNSEEGDDGVSTGKQGDELKRFRQEVALCYQSKRLMSKKMGRREVRDIVDALMHSKRTADERALAHIRDPTREGEVVARLREAYGPSSAASSHELDLQMLRGSRHNTYRSSSSGKEISTQQDTPLPLVETTEAYLYRYFKTKSSSAVSSSTLSGPLYGSGYGKGTSSIAKGLDAAEQCAVFMKSLESYCTGVGESRDPRAPTAGLSHDRTHTRCGDAMLQTFMGVLCHEIDEGYYDRQKECLNRIHSMLLEEIRREHPNLSMKQRQASLDTKLNGWMSEEEYLYFIQILLGEDELIATEDSDAEDDEDLILEGAMDTVNSSYGRHDGSSDLLAHRNSRRKGLVIDRTSEEVGDAIAIYDGGRRHKVSAGGGRKTGRNLVLLLKRIAIEERDREIEAATNSKVVNTTNGSLGNHATMGFLTYHSSVLASPVKKMKKTQAVQGAWDSKDKGRRLRTADFIDTFLSYQLRVYTQYLLPLRQAFRARDRSNRGTMPLEDLAKIFMDDLQHRDYPVLPAKHTESTVAGTFGGIRPGSDAAALMKQSHEVARQRAVYELLRKMMDVTDPRLTGMTTFSRVVQGFMLL
jgi:hypothetical protein